jgi:tol-pal system protein YbgF
MFLLALSVALPVLAADEQELLSGMTVQQRLERVERIVGSDVLMEQSRQIEELKQEVSILREMLEQKDYELDLIKQRQRSLYVDMDRRLNNIEGGASHTVVAAPVPPPAGPGGSSTSTAAVVNTADKDGKQQYSAAFDLLKEGRYQDSIAAFSGFLKQYPESRYADNAQYWLGEANYVSRQYEQALNEFQKLIAGYPESSKLPGARLKIGYTYYELRNWQAATEALQQVIKLYPDATVAKKASERLDRIKREGH